MSLHELISQALSSRQARQERKEGNRILLGALCAFASDNVLYSFSLVAPTVALSPSY
jgi:hypothetical protein